MPLPLIIGAAALAASAYAVKKGYDGHQKHSEADDIVQKAKDEYAGKRREFDIQEREAQQALSQLGVLELEIGKNFGDFKTLSDSLLKKLGDRQGVDLKLDIPEKTLKKIETYSYSAIGVLGSAVGAGAAGVAAGFAVYGGVMALGAASTGTAISSLAGVAATNATLAAIGGGSLAAGGLGMAGGIAILGVAVAAPVLAIAGWAYDSHGDESLKNARNVDSQVTAAIDKLRRAGATLGEMQHYSRKIRRTLQSIFGQFNGYFDHLKNINAFIEDMKGRNVDVDAELAKHGDAIMSNIENGYALAAILTDVITTPIFKLLKRNGEVVKDENGVPEMEKDAYGSMLVDVSNLDAALVKASASAGNHTA